MRRLLLPLILTAPLAVVDGTGQVPRPAERTTALDRYVAAPDSSFAWKAVRDLPAEGVTATLIDMTSQR